jgi:hypothetical protein
MMDLSEHTGTIELDVIVVRRAFGREVLGQLAPLSAGSEHVNSISAYSSSVRSLSYLKPLPRSAPGSRPSTCPPPRIMRTGIANHK